MFSFLKPQIKFRGDRPTQTLKKKLRKYCIANYWLKPIYFTAKTNETRKDFVAMALESFFIWQ